jgi:hypothetical protein
MEVMGSAYLSELKGRKAVTIEDFRNFCSDLASKEQDREAAILRIVETLMEPYQN